MADSEIFLLFFDNFMIEYFTLYLELYNPQFPQFLFILRFLTCGVLPLAPIVMLTFGGTGKP